MHALLDAGERVHRHGACRRSARSTSNLGAWSCDCVDLGARAASSRSARLLISCSSADRSPAWRRSADLLAEAAHESRGRRSREWRQRLANAARRGRAARPRLTEARHRLGCSGRCAEIGCLSAASTSSAFSPTLASARLSTIARRVLGRAQRVQRVDGDPEVLDRRDVERGDEHRQVAEVARREDVLGEVRRGVDDDVVVAFRGPRASSSSTTADGNTVGIRRDRLARR